MNVETLAGMADKLNIKNSPLKAKYISSFREKGMKEIVTDSYKFTNLDSFFQTLRFNDGKATLNPRKLEVPTLYLTNGILDKHDALPEGLTLRKTTLADEALKPFLVELNPLSNLHRGLLDEVLVLEVAKNKEVTGAVRLQNSITSSTLSSGALFIIGHANSKLTVLEESIAAPDVPHAFVTETYIRAEDGAKIEHVLLEEENLEGINHTSIAAEVARDAGVRSVILNTSGKLNRKNLSLNLNESGAHGESFVLYLTKGEEHSDVNTVINHKAADTTSDQLAKGILDGDSKGIFTGKIHIYPKAQRVASGQLNKNLLLSKKAQAHSQPQLEIFADDVKCSHGSTTGQLSPEELFYFQARGIPADKARTLLAYGFGLEVVLKIENDQIRNYVSEIMKQKLAEKFSLGVL